MINHKQPLPTETIIGRAFRRLIAATDALSDLPITASSRERLEAAFFLLTDDRTDRMIRSDYILTLLNIALEPRGIMVASDDFAEVIAGFELDTYTDLDGIVYLLGVGLPGLDEARIEDGREAIERYLLALRRASSEMS